MFLPFYSATYRKKITHKPLPSTVVACISKQIFIKYRYPTVAVFLYPPIPKAKTPAPLHKGYTYLLMVHNYSSATGFTLSFGKLTLQADVSPLTTIGEVYPNPTTQDAFLPITLAEATTLDFLLLRANGQVLQHKVLDLPAGAQRLPIIMPDDHANELLYIRLLINGQVVHRKVVR